MESIISISFSILIAVCWIGSLVLGIIAGIAIGAQERKTRIRLREDTIASLKQDKGMFKAFPNPIGSIAHSTYFLSHEDSDPTHQEFCITFSHRDWLKLQSKEWYPELSEFLDNLEIQDMHSQLPKKEDIQA